MISITLEMVSRELLMLSVIAALGAGPASFLCSRFDSAARAAMAPVLGICVGTCFCTTLIWFFPAARTSWLVAVLASASLAVAGVRWSWRRSRPRGVQAPGTGQEVATAAATTTRRALVDVLQVLVVCLAISGPITSAFVARESVGPVGYKIADVQGYVPEIDGMQRESIQSAQRLVSSTAYQANLSQRFWSTYASGFQELDATPLSANVDELVGLNATDTQSSYLIAFLMVGGLGLFAAVRYVTRRPTWAAMLGGVLFGGAFFLELFFDGSEGAITGLVVLVPLTVLGAEALRSPGPTHLALCALVLSGLVAFYPVFVPSVVIGAVIVGALLGVTRIRSARIDRRSLALAASRIGVVIGAASLLNLVDADRAIRYWNGLLHGDYLSNSSYQYAKLPGYPFLRLEVLPSWLLQLRQFYDFEYSVWSVPERMVIGVAVPLMLAAVALAGLRRHLAPWVLLSMLGAAFLIAEYEATVHSSSYGEDRAILPVAPILVFLVVLGIAGLAVSTSKLRRGVAILAVAVTLAATIPAAYSSLTRFREGSYFLDTSLRTLLTHVPARGDVELEGFDDNPQSGIEDGLVYLLGEEYAWGRVSLPADRDEPNTLTYFPYRPSHPAYPIFGRQFDPSYTTVLTGLAGVTTHRRVLARAGGAALEVRSGPLDILVDDGLTAVETRGANLAYVDPTASAPVEFLVVGRSNRPVSIVLTFRLGES